MQQYHIPVLVNEVIQNLPQNTNFVFDWTLGHWGHAKYILDLKNVKKYIGVDRDEKIFPKAKARLASYNQVVFINDVYSNIDKISQNLNISNYDVIFLDLWVNMEHFKDPNRGFSIKQNWPLDMRFSSNVKLTARDIIYNYSIDKLAEILNKYWDFSPKFAQKISSYIVSQRKKKR